MTTDPGRTPPPQQNPPNRSPAPSLGYASSKYDLARDLQSLDREMTARLSRTFGWCLLLVGAAAALVLLPIAGQVARGAPGSQLVAVGVPVLVFLLPGLALLASVGPIRAASKAAAVVVLVAGIWLGLGLSLSLLAIGMRMWVGGAIGPSAVLEGLILLALLAGTVKLLYHDIRLFAAPGRGAAQDAITDVSEVLGGGIDGTDEHAGMSRLGILRAVTGAMVSIFASVLLWMTLSPAPNPPSPPPPPEAVTAFGGDVHRPGGLPAAERAIVVAHLAQTAGLNAGERRLLDDLLREVGRAMLDRAEWPAGSVQGVPPAPTGPAPSPLTEDEIARRLPVLRPGIELPDEPPPPIRPGPPDRRVQFGGWTARFEASRALIFAPDRGLWGASTRGRHDGVVMLRGDFFHQKEFDSSRHGQSWAWTDGAAGRLLERVSLGAMPSKPGGVRRPTIAQADAVVGIIRGQTFTEAQVRDPAGPPKPPGVTMRQDGMLEVRDPAGGTSWIAVDGQHHTTSPEQRATLAAAAPKPRRLRASALAAAAGLLAAVASAGLGVLLARAARRARATADGNAPTTRNLLRGLRYASLAGLVAGAWCLKTLWAGEPQVRRWLWDPVFLTGFFLVVTFALWSGFWAPMAVSQRLEERLAHRRTGGRGGSLRGVQLVGHPQGGADE